MMFDYFFNLNFRIVFYSTVIFDHINEHMFIIRENFFDVFFLNFIT